MGVGRVSSKSNLLAYRSITITAVALIIATVTCTEDRTPLAPTGGSAIAPALVSGTIAHTLLASGSNATNQKIYTTASITPAPNALITVAVLGRRSSGGPLTPVVTGGGMATWTQVASVDYAPIATPTSRLVVFRALSGAPTSGPVTITFASSVSNATWVVSQWTGVDVSGVNGAGAIVQSGSTRSDAASALSTTLAALADPNDVTVGLVGASLNAPAVTPGAGFTEIAEPTSGESNLLQAEWGVNLSTVAATLTSAKNAALLGLELRADGGGGGGGGGVDAGKTTVETAPTAITAGSGSSTITVTAKDANDQPVSGASVVLAATGTGNALTQPVGPTGPDGVATGSLSSTVAGAKVISAKVNGTTITQTATLTVTAGAVSATQSTIQAAPTAIAPLVGTATITVRALDDNGNPISGATVVLAASGMGTLTQPATPTDANGVTTGSVKSMMEETITVSATINTTAITQTAAVQVVAQPTGTITHTLLTFGNNAVNQRVYPTASISPAPTTLVTVAVLMRRSSGALSPTITGGGMTTWDVVASTDFDTQGTPTKRLTIFRALSAAPGSGPITITFPSSVSNVQWIVSQWTGVETSGTNGSGAIAQTAVARSDNATTLTATLAPFASANDVAYGVAGVAKNGPIVTPASGFTEIAEVSSGETSALQTEWATNRASVGASWTTLTKAGMLGVEIRAGNQGPVVPVATVEVIPASAIVAVGGTVQLTASLKDAAGEPLDGRVVTWTSNASGIADVSTTGLVTGRAAGGPVTITATSEGKSGTSSVTVTATAEPVSSVEVTPGSATIVVGGTVLLTATPKDAGGQPLTGRTITWSTNASSVATVSNSGLVTGVGAGPATITATSEGKSGSSSITVTTGGMAALVGEWSAVLPAPIVQVHLHLLVDGRVLSFGGSSGIPQVWDPATGVFTAVPSPALMFCSGHNFLPDGRLLVSGGGTGNGLGHTNSDIFDAATTSWIVGPEMAYARWYPTNTTMPNGEVVTMAGADENGNAVPIPEIGDGTSWRQLTGASLTLSNYPRNFVAPDGRLFVAGPSAGSHWLDVTGTGSWTDGPTMNGGSRSYGSAVMYEAGKILFVGGNSSPTNTAEIIDLHQASPQWSFTGSLTYSRWNLNATVLPTGDVLVTGGVNGSRSNPALKVNATELWNPVTGTWTLMASSAPLLRGYHSTALLLPDGRVIHSGGGAGGGTIDNLNFEIYSPPYLFKGARPNVTGVIGAVGYGQSVLAVTQDGASITKVTLIHTGSVTHAFDEAQRLVSLSFSAVSGGVSVTLPASRNTAPPGPYMLFLVNGNGVPSVGQIILLQ